MCASEVSILMRSTKTIDRRELQRPHTGNATHDMFNSREASFLEKPFLPSLPSFRLGESVWTRPTLSGHSVLGRDARRSAAAVAAAGGDANGGGAGSAGGCGGGGEGGTDVCSLVGGRPGARCAANDVAVLGLPLSLSSARVSRGALPMAVLVAGGLWRCVGGSTHSESSATRR